MNSYLPFPPRVVRYCQRHLSRYLIERGWVVVMEADWCNTVCARSAQCYRPERRLGGVVVSVLATRPKGYGLEPGQGNGYLWAIKIRSTPSSRMGSKAGRSHVIRFLRF
jgi:hypothetical protein